MKKKCPHGAVLPKGLRCSRGYLFISIETDKGPYHRGCGPHNKSMETVARLEIARIREQQYLGTFGLPSKTKRLKFRESAVIFQERHFVKYRDPNTNAPRAAIVISTNQSRLNTLGEFFNDFYLDAITLKDLKSYREKRMDFDGIAGSTINRDMAILSSIFTQFERWNEEDNKAEKIKLPEKNPCRLLPDLTEKPRNYPLRMEVLKFLKQSCYELGDQAMWSVIETDLHTSLRLNDLMRLENKKIDGSQFTVNQSKTGKDISFPASVAPQWSKVFANFRRRWESVRDRASRLLMADGQRGCHDLQFRDIRKWGLQLLERLLDENGLRKFSDEQLATKGGHADSKVTKKWYLEGNQAEQLRPMIDATKKLLEGL